jgi:hypothetical protein
LHLDLSLNMNRSRGIFRFSVTILIVTVGIFVAMRYDQQRLTFGQTGATGVSPGPTGQPPTTGTMPPGVATGTQEAHAVPSLVGQPMLYEKVPVRDVPSQNPRVTMRPGVAVAAVGTNVSLRAGVLYPDGYLRTNQRIDWSLTGVGYISTVDAGIWTDFFVGDWTRAGKIDNRHAVNSTSRRPLTATGGTETTEDDADVFPGEAVISITSMTEGTSYVTASAAKITDPNDGQRIAVVHWVDAFWTWPEAPVAPAGKSRILTTRIVRRISGLPCTDWIVRYRFVSGVEAGFGANFEQQVDVTTDQSGQASIEIAQPDPRPGQSRIEIDVIWIDKVSGAATTDSSTSRSTADQEGVKSLTIARTTLPVIWTPSDLMLSISGSASANPGDLLDYRLEFSNEGAWASPTTQLSLQIPAGLRPTSLPAPARMAPDGRSWNAALLPLEPGEAREASMQFVAATPGRYPMRASILHQGNVLASESMTVQVGIPLGGSMPLIDPPIINSNPDGGGTQPFVDIYPTPSDRPVIVRPRSSELPKLYVVIAPDNSATADRRVGGKIPIYFSVLNEENEVVSDCSLRIRYGDAFTSESGGDRVILKLPDLPARSALPDEATPEIMLEVIRATDSFISAEVLDSRGNVIASDHFTYSTLPAGTPSPGAIGSETGSSGLQASVQMSHGTLEGPPGDFPLGESMRVQVEVMNSGYQTLKNVRLSCLPEADFEAIQATTGHQFIEGGFVLDLPDLAPDEGGSLTVDLRPRNAQADAVVLMSVLQDGRVIAEDVIRLNVQETGVGGN